MCLITYSVVMSLDKVRMCYGLPTYLFVQSTPSLFDGAWARSLTMPAPVAKLMTFCQPAALKLTQWGQVRF